MYSSYSFQTSAVEGEEWSVSHPGCAFTLGERKIKLSRIARKATATENLWVAGMEILVTVSSLSIKEATIYNKL
jgi:hypothetical protein